MLTTKRYYCIGFLFVTWSKEGKLFLITRLNTNLVIIAVGIERNDKYNTTRIPKFFDTIGTLGIMELEATSDTIERPIANT